MEGRAGRVAFDKQGWGVDVTKVGAYKHGRSVDAAKAGGDKQGRGVDATTATDVIELWKYGV